MSRSVSRRAQRTWDRLGSWYGARFAEQWGKNPPEDWCAVIDATDDARLSAALSSLRQAAPIHPPSLGQLEAAIPKRHDRNKCTAQLLADHVVENHSLCRHQLVGWSFFGQLRPPEVRGVVVPGCSECGRLNIRVVEADLVGSAVAAA